MYRKSSQTILKKIGPEEATKFLSYNNFPGQRNHNQAKSKGYADGMESGTMRDVDIAIATTPDGIRWMMNGQHVCYAIIQYGKPYGARIDYYKCDSMTDLWHLFSTFDVHAARTEGQIVKGAKGLFLNTFLHDVPIRILTVCGTALFFLSFGQRPLFGKKAPLKSTKCDLIEKYSKEVLWIASIIPKSHEKNQSFMERVGVVTSMIGTYRKNQQKAIEFWSGVRDLDMIKKDDPRRKLHDSLLSNAGNNCKGGGGGHNVHTFIYATCVSWWNSWITGEKRHSVKVKGMKELPIIKG